MNSVLCTHTSCRVAVDDIVVAVVGALIRGGRCAGHLAVLRGRSARAGTHIVAVCAGLHEKCGRGCLAARGGGVELVN